MDTIHTEEYKGHTIEIYPDDCSENPIKEWDGNVEFCCWCRRYNLGNSKRFGNGMGSPEECQEYAKSTNSILLPLFIYDHSGIALSLGREYPFNCPWDSGQLGYVLIDRQWLKDSYGKSYFTRKIRKQLYEHAQSNVDTYNDYLSGNVYGYIINGDLCNDSCSGFYGDYDDYCLSEAKSIIDYSIKRAQTEHFSKLKQWIKNGVGFQYRTPLPN